MDLEERDQLRRQYVATVLDSMKRYILEGHDFTLHTEHDGYPDGSRVVFTMRSWNTFTDLLKQEGQHRAQDRHVARERSAAACGGSNQRRTFER